jgi:2-(1,2-epoxy-1,2-dihydrophenyl)acetyl-CoA isomerase
MSDVPVQIDKTHGVGIIRLNRPDSMNALDTPTKMALLGALREVADDESVRCVVLIGSGRAFCAGQDLKEHASRLAAGDLAGLWSTVPEHYNPIALAIHTMAKPTVAAVNGMAAGAGAAIAFLTDYRIVSESAGFNLAFARIGLSCDTGTSWTLPRLVGPTKAMELLLNARTVGAREALAIGLASEVVADDRFAARVQEFATDLAQGPTLAFASMRRVVSFSANHSLAESIELEGEMMRLTGASADHRVAVDAFLAKEKPGFTGR